MDNKPFFVTSTKRPVETPIDITGDNLSVRELQTVTAEELITLEHLSGMEIKNDADLAKAKQIVLKDTINKNKSAATGEPTDVVNKEVDPIAEQEKEESLFARFQKACLNGFGCTLPSFGDKLGLLKYAKMIKDFLSDIFKVPLSVLKAIVRCGTFLASTALSAVNNLAKKIVKLGSPDAVNDIGESLKDKYGRNVNMESKVPNTLQLFIETIGNVSKIGLALVGIKTLMSTFGIGQDSILGSVKNYYNTYYTTNTKKVSKLFKPEDPQKTLDNVLKEYKVANKANPVRTNVIAEITKKDEAAIVPVTEAGMTARVIEKINNGDVLTAIIPEEVLGGVNVNSIKSDTSITSKLTTVPFIVRNLRAGNFDEEVKSSRLLSRFKKHTEIGRTQDFLDAYPDIDVVDLVNHSQISPNMPKVNLSKFDRAVIIKSAFDRKYSSITARYN